MRQSTQRQVLAGVLGLGAAAVLVDRLLLAPPEPAGAAPAPVLAQAGETGGSVATDARGAGKTPPALGGIRNNLHAALGVPEWSKDEIRASLRPTPAWALYSDPKDVQTSPQGLSVADRFRRDYRLKAVMRRGEQAAVSLDGPEVAAHKSTGVLWVGQSIQGFKLVSVGDSSAVFEAGAQVVELTIETPKSMVTITDR